MYIRWHPPGTRAFGRHLGPASCAPRRDAADVSREPGGVACRAQGPAWGTRGLPEWTNGL